MERSEVAKRYKVSVRTLERWATRGIGPEPVRLGPRLLRYRRAEVDAYASQSGQPA
ncbi:helix-turn-helix domain-containing protein [Nonomuraea sp. NPDC055795]